MVGMTHGVQVLEGSLARVRLLERKPDLGSLRKTAGRLLSLVKGVAIRCIGLLLNGLRRPMRGKAHHVMIFEACLRAAYIRVVR